MTAKSANNSAYGEEQASSFDLESWEKFWQSLLSYKADAQTRLAQNLATQRDNVKHYTNQAVTAAKEFHQTAQANDPLAGQSMAKQYLNIKETTWPALKAGVSAMAVTTAISMGAKFALSTAFNAAGLGVVAGLSGVIVSVGMSARQDWDSKQSVKENLKNTLTNYSTWRKAALSGALATVGIVGAEGADLMPSAEAASCNSFESDPIVNVQNLQLSVSNIAEPTMADLNSCSAQFAAEDKIAVAQDETTAPNEDNGFDNALSGMTDQARDIWNSAREAGGELIDRSKEAFDWDSMGAIDGIETEPQAPIEQADIPQENIPQSNIPSDAPVTDTPTPQHSINDGHGHGVGCRTFSGSGYEDKCIILGEENSISTELDAHHDDHEIDSTTRTEHMPDEFEVEIVGTAQEVETESTIDTAAADNQEAKLSPEHTVYDPDTKTWNAPVSNDNISIEAIPSGSTYDPIKDEWDIPMAEAIEVEPEVWQSAEAKPEIEAKPEAYDSGTITDNAENPVVDPTGYHVHVLKAGESISALAKEFYGASTLAEFEKGIELIGGANGISSLEINGVHAGDVVYIPDMNEDNFAQYATDYDMQELAADIADGNPADYWDGKSTFAPALAQ